MDRKLPKKHFLIRYKYHVLSALSFLILLIIMIIQIIEPMKLKVKSNDIIIANVTRDKFLEYIEVEGVIQPFKTIKINSRQSGYVDKIFVEEGSYLHEGDTIFTLNNPLLIKDINEKKEEWQRSLIKFKEREIEMQQKTLNLKQQALQNNYELKRLKRSFDLDNEEYKMGIKSKAQLQLSQEEYNYKYESTMIQQENIRHDSIATIIKKQLIEKEHEIEKQKYLESLDRYAELIIKAPVSGQLSYMELIPGQRINSGESFGEIKMMDKFKLKTSINEYYVDRFAISMSGNITYADKKYPLKVCKIVPEIKNKNFNVDLLFNDSIPENARVGKSYRVKIELSTTDETIIIPKGDFYRYTMGKWLFIIDESGKKAIKKEICIGRQNPLFYEIISGINPGDKVIITGYEKFQDSQILIID